MNEANASATTRRWCADGAEPSARGVTDPPGAAGGAVCSAAGWCIAGAGGAGVGGVCTAAGAEDHQRQAMRDMGKDVARLDR